MVRIHHSTTDKSTAWRVRDALACHPLLGGAMAQISVAAGNNHIVLKGWVADDALSQTALRLTIRAAGRRPVYLELQEGRCISCRGESSVSLREGLI
jgi:hypothetical protein